jgi:UDP-N-acetylglucosamine 2-epimerase
MTKVMTIVGTRPELIKMSRVIACFDEHTDHVLVHTGQNHDYTLNQVFFDELKIRKPDFFLKVASATPAQTIARVIEQSDAVFEQVKPDALLIYGDTNSALAVIAAKRRKIPVFHMEAGNRCFDERVPEEINRKILDHLSDINMVLTEHARRYLIAEGISQDRIVKTGSHMQEVLAYYRDDIAASDVLQRLSLKEKGYFIVSAHREENVDQPNRLAALMDALSALHEAYNLPVFVSVHPRTRARMEESGMSMTQDKGVHFMQPFGFLDYIKLQQHAFCVVSDSGTITEEAALLSFPAVTIRDAHERPEGMDSGTLLRVDCHAHAIKEAVDVAVKSQDRLGHQLGRVSDFEGGLVSDKVLRVVLSSIDIIRRKVWMKSSRDIVHKQTD